MSASPHKLITAIVPAGVAMPVVRRLREELGVITAQVRHARGAGHLHLRVGRRGLREQTEKDVIQVSVATERADAVFEFIYFAAGIDKPHGGVVYQTALLRSTTFTLPELPEEH